MERILNTIICLLVLTACGSDSDGESGETTIINNNNIIVEVPTPDVIINPDGSTTITVISDDGSATSTTENVDGSVEEITAHADGTTTTIENDLDGTTTTTVIEADGQGTQTVVDADGNTSEFTVDSSGVITPVDSVGDGFNMPEMLTNIADNIITPQYQKLSDDADELELLITHYCADTSDNMKLSNAQNQWLETAKSYHQTTSYQVVPFDYQLINYYSDISKINPSVIDEEMYDYQLSDTPLGIMGEGVDGQILGLTAIEYLLFNNTPEELKSDDTDAVNAWTALSDDNARITARCEFTQKIAERLSSDAETLDTLWVDSYKEEFTSNKDESLVQLFRGLFFLDINVKDVKLAQPLSLNEKCSRDCAENVESPFAHESLQLIKANLESFQQILTGEGGFGLGELIVQEGYAEIADALIGSSSTAIEIINTNGSNNISLYNFSSAVDNTACANSSANPESGDSLCHLYGYINRITDSLKTDITVILDIDISVLTPAPPEVSICSSDYSRVKNIAGEYISVPTTYVFGSSLEEGICSVSYTDQTARNVMIEDMESAIASSGLTNSTGPLADLQSAFGTQGSLDDSHHGITSKDGFTVIPGTTYGDISTGKNLVAKIAGNDKCAGVNTQLIGQTEGIDTTIATAFINSEVEWKCTLSDTSKGEAQQLIEYYFTQIADKITGNVDTVATSSGVQELPVYVDAEGRDYQQLISKSLLGAVAFNQGVNDYLIGALTASHTADKGTKPYTTAEHKWDEAFGYFGAARDYQDYSDLAIGNGNVIDSNADGLADLRSEINMNHSLDCAKRDHVMSGASMADQTNYTKEVFDAFVEGRAILSHLAKAQAELSSYDFDNLKNTLAPELEARAKAAANTWEKCIAATVVHHINMSVEDINAAVANSNQFADMAAFATYSRHWSAMKGHALGLQYNPNSPIYSKVGNLTAYTDAMALMADQPSLGANLSAYKTSLISARDKLQAIYGFTNYQAQNW